MESPTPTFQPVGMRPQNYACIIYCKNHLILVVSINFLRYCNVCVVCLGFTIFLMVSTYWLSVYLIMTSCSHSQIVALHVFRQLLGSVVNAEMPRGLLHVKIISVLQSLKDLIKTAFSTEISGPSDPM